MATIQVADKPTLDTVKNEVQNSTYGLQAIQTAISGIGGGALVPTVLSRESISSDTTLAFKPSASQSSTYKYFTASVYNTGPISNTFDYLYIDSATSAVPCVISQETGVATFVFTSYFKVVSHAKTSGSMIIYGWK